MEIIFIKYNHEYLKIKSCLALIEKVEEEIKNNTYI